MGIQWINLRDETGRQSSIGIYDGKGSGSEGVQIVGTLHHCAEFSLAEFDRFVRVYLAARGYDVPDRIDPDDVQGSNGSPVDDALDLLGRHLQGDDNSAHDALDVLRQAFHASLARLAS